MGNYASLFESQEAQDASIPSWDSMLWITEHYQNARTKETPWDLLYQKEVEPNWTRDAPTAVNATGVYCDLAPHQLLWAPDATIDSQDYNWPIKEGHFDAPFECTIAYTLSMRNSLLDIYECWRLCVLPTSSTTGPFVLSMSSEVVVKRLMTSGCKINS